MEQLKSEQSNENDLEWLKPLVGSASYLPEIINFVKSQTEPDPAHDWLHIQRVAMNANRIAKKEKASVLLVTIASLLHDIKNLPKSDPQSHLSSQLSAAFARDYLCMFPLTAQEVDIIADAILNHSYSRGQSPSTLEGKVVQDADRLDSLGAIGIARCFVVGGCHQRLMYQGNDPFYDARRALDDKTFTLDHFYKKLFTLPDLMQTKTGRVLALARVDKMKSFLAWMSDEIMG